MPQRVLLISNMYPAAHDPTYGVFVERCGVALAAAGIQVRRVVMHKHGHLLPKLAAYLRFAIEANGCLMFGRYDCVYVHQPLHSLLASLPAGLWVSAPWVLNFHGHDLMPVTRRGRLLHRWLRPLFGRAQAVLVPSLHFKRHYDTEVSPLKGPRAQCFASGGVADRYFDGPCLPISSRGRTALFLARWVPEKGWLEFLALAQALLAEQGDFRFTLAGSGAERPLLERAVAALGLRDRVDIVETSGVAANQALYLRHRYFVMPSRFEESLGLANLEAMACACIVLSSDFAAASEYIDSGVDGLRLPRDGFVAAAMLAIRRLEQDLPGAEAMSHAARRRAAGFKESRVMAGLPALLGLQGSLP